MNLKNLGPAKIVGATVAVVGIVVGFTAKLFATRLATDGSDGLLERVGWLAFGAALLGAVGYMLIDLFSSEDDSSEDDEAELNPEQVIDRRRQKNEFRKEAHRRHLEFFAAGIVAIGVIVAVIGIFGCDASLKPTFTTLLTTILGAAMGFVLKTRSDQTPTS